MKTDRPIFFLARRQADGKFCIFNVDIFGVGAPTAALSPEHIEARTGNIDRAWLSAAAGRHTKLRADNGYVPPVHIYHNEDGTNDNRDKVGFMAEMRGGDGGMSVKEVDVPVKDANGKITAQATLIAQANNPDYLYCNIRDIEPEVFEKIRQKKLPYRSVEILDINVPDISSLALMFSTPPFFPLRPLNVILDEATVEPAFNFQPAMAAHFSAKRGRFYTTKSEDRSMLNVFAVVRKVKATKLCSTDAAVKRAVKLVFAAEGTALKDEDLEDAMVAAAVVDEPNTAADMKAEDPAKKDEVKAAATDPEEKKDEVKASADDDADDKKDVKAAADDAEEEKKDVKAAATDTEEKEQFGGWQPVEGKDGWYLTEDGVERKGPFPDQDSAMESLNEMKKMAATPDTEEKTAEKTALKAPAKKAPAIKLLGDDNKPKKPEIKKPTSGIKLLGDAQPPEEVKAAADDTMSDEEAIAMAAEKAGDKPADNPDEVKAAAPDAKAPDATVKMDGVEEAEAEIPVASKQMIDLMVKTAARVMEQALAPIIADMRGMLSKQDQYSAPNAIPESSPIAKMSANGRKDNLSLRVEELEQRLAHEARINKFTSKLRKAVEESGGNLRMDIDGIARFAAELPVKEQKVMGRDKKVTTEQVDMGERHIDALLMQAGMDMPPPPVSYGAHSDGPRFMDPEIEPYLSNTEALRVAQLAAQQWDQDEQLQKHVKRGKYIASEVFSATRFNADATHAGNGRNGSARK